MGFWVRVVAIYHGSHGATAKDIPSSVGHIPERSVVWHSAAAGLTLLLSAPKSF